MVSSCLQEQEKFLRLLTTYHLPLALRVNSQYHRNSRLALIQVSLIVHLSLSLHSYLQRLSHVMSHVTHQEELCLCPMAKTKLCDSRLRGHCCSRLCVCVCTVCAAGPRRAVRLLGGLLRAETAHAGASKHRLYCTSCISIISNLHF